MASAFLPELSEYDLKSLLFSFKPRKSPGVDNIRANYLSRNFDAIKHVLLHMLNGFIAQRKIPNNLKNANVKPLHKGGDRRKVENYRPISILSCISQILEKHLFQVMSQFLEFGFVNGRGTQPLLEDFADELHYAFEKKMRSYVPFLWMFQRHSTVLTTAFYSKSFIILASKVHLWSY